MAIMKKGDEPENWNGNNDYSPGARCLHNGYTWEAGATGIYNPSIEPGGLAAGGYWKKIN